LLTATEEAAIPADLALEMLILRAFRSVMATVSASFFGGTNRLAKA